MTGTTFSACPDLPCAGDPQFTNTQQESNDMTPVMVIVIVVLGLILVAVLVLIVRKVRINIQKADEVSILYDNRSASDTPANVVKEKSAECQEINTNLRTNVYNSFDDKDKDTLSVSTNSDISQTYSGSQRRRRQLPTPPVFLDGNQGFSNQGFCNEEGNLGNIKISENVNKSGSRGRKLPDVIAITESVKNRNSAKTDDREMLRRHRSARVKLAGPDIQKITPPRKPPRQKNVMSHTDLRHKQSEDKNVLVLQDFADFGEFDETNGSLV